MWAETLLYSAYYLVSFLYLVCGIILLVRPGIIEHIIPKLFPLLAHFKLQRISNALNLIVVGCILLITADYLLEKEFIGFFIALVLSLWEVYLSVTFYLKHHSRFDVWSHFLIHVVIALFVGWVLLVNYERQIAVLNDIWLVILAPDMMRLYFMNVFHEHILVIAFLVCLLGGEPAVLLFAFLSAQGIISPFEVVAIGLVTALIGELFWFLFARTRFFNFLNSWFFEKEKENRLFSRIEKTIAKSPFKTFFLARFISGITILCIIYLSKKRLQLKTFVWYCLGVNFFWAPIVTLVGWSSGKGFTLVLETFKNIQVALNITAACIILGYFLHKFIGRRIVQASTKIELID